MHHTITKSVAAFSLSHHNFIIQRFIIYFSIERRNFTLTHLVDNLDFIVFRRTVPFRRHYDKACSACRNGLYRMTIWTFREYGRRLSGMRKSLFRAPPFSISRKTSVNIFYFHECIIPKPVIRLRFDYALMSSVLLAVLTKA